jgi:hypothetical protein
MEDKPSFGQQLFSKSASIEHVQEEVKSSGPADDVSGSSEFLGDLQYNIDYVNLDYVNDYVGYVIMNSRNCW